VRRERDIARRHGNAVLDGISLGDITTSMTINSRRR
jgi:hypothetical protein